MKQRRISSCLAILAGLLCAFFAIPHQQAHAAGLLIADNGFGGVLEIKEHSARVVVNNGVAVTEVTQVFQNTENRQVEALYTFPVPKGASVANFSMWINGVEMVGEVLEKQRAKQIYESYKQTRKDPGLLEQVDYRTFEMRVFPIGPRAEQRVQVVYYQELDFDHDAATYVYPLATATRKVTSDRTTGKFGLTLEVKSEIPIKGMESPSHGKDFAIARHGDEHYQASLEVTGGSLAKDVVVSYEISRPKTGVDLIASKQGGEDGYFCLTLTAGDELPHKDGAMDYVFLLDVSGSMADNQKLAVSRNSLASFIEALGEQDRFEVLAFNVAPTTLFRQLNNADEQAKKRATEFLQSQQARGGTVLNPAVTTAYKYADPQRPLNVIILSDGLTEQGERSQLVQLIRSRPQNTRVFCIGVGNDVNRAMLEQLANESGGLAAFVSPEDDFQRQAQAFRRKLMRPVATDLRFTFNGVEVYDVEPQQLPNLYHGSPVRLYGRYKGDGEVKVGIAANVLGQPITKNVELELPKRDDENPEIERMWAWHRVQRLLKEADARGSRSSVVDEIVRLGEGYSIVTEYTSFIVLENDAEYRRWKIDRKNMLRLERDRVAQQRVREQLASLRDQANDQLGPVTDVQKLAMLPQQQQRRQQPVPQPPASSPQADSSRNASSTPERSRSRDVNFGGGGGGGGGAIDPVSGGILLSLGAIALATKVRRKSA